MKWATFSKDQLNHLANVAEVVRDQMLVEEGQKGRVTKLVTKLRRSSLEMAHKFDKDTTLIPFNDEDMDFLDKLIYTDKSGRRTTKRLPEDTTGLDDYDIFGKEAM